MIKTHELVILILTNLPSPETSLLSHLRPLTVTKVTQRTDEVFRLIIKGDTASVVVCADASHRAVGRIPFVHFAVEQPDDISTDRAFRVGQ